MFQITIAENLFFQLAIIGAWAGGGLRRCTDTSQEYTSISILELHSAATTANPNPISCLHADINPLLADHHC